MSFLKIEDPNKRNQIVKEFIESRKKIQANSLRERTGDIELRRETSKLFAPITEATKETQKAIESGLAPLSNLPAILPAPALTAEATQPAIESAAQPLATTVFGPTATTYMKNYLTKTNSDKVFGIHAQDEKFFIGNKEIEIDDDDIIIEGKTYEGTPGLWELITSNNPQNYLESDMKNYADILISTML